MKKQLPVNLNPGISSQCFTYYRLAAILANESNRAWFAEKFYNVYLSSSFITQFARFASEEYLSMYDEILEVREIPVSSTPDVVREIIRSIDDNGYIVSCADKYHIHGAGEFLKEHSLHDVLVYGYDTASKEFDFLDFNVDGVPYGSHKISFEDYVASFYSGLGILKNQIFHLDYISRDASYLVNNLPISALHVKDFKRKPDMVRILNSVVQYYNGYELTDTAPSGSGGLQKPGWYGTAVYRGYYDKFVNALLRPDTEQHLDKYMVFVRLRVLLESKSILSAKLKFLRDSNRIDLQGGLLEQIGLLHRKIGLSIHLLAKFEYSRNKDTLTRAAELYREAEKLDRLVTEEVMQIIYEAVKREKF